MAIKDVIPKSKDEQLAAFTKLANLSNEAVLTIPDADSDGSIYGRKNGDWVAVPEGDFVPDDDGSTAGDVLTTDGDGSYTWETPASGEFMPSAASVADGKVLTADGSDGAEWRSLPQGEAVSDADGDAEAQLNALLASLRAAGIIATGD